MDHGTLGFIVLIYSEHVGRIAGLLPFKVRIPSLATFFVRVFGVQCVIML